MAELQRRLGIEDDMFQAHILSDANENLRQRSNGAAEQNITDEAEAKQERIRTRFAEHSSENIRLEITQSTITRERPNQAEAHAPRNKNSQRQANLPSSPPRHQAVGIGESVHQATENRRLKFFPPLSTCPICTLDNPASCLACSARRSKFGSKSIGQDNMLPSKHKSASQEPADTVPRLDGTNLPTPNLATPVVEKHIKMYSDEKQAVRLSPPPIKHLNGKDTVRDPSRTVREHAQKDNVSCENQIQSPDDFQHKEVLEGPVQERNLENMRPSITPESNKIARKLVMDIQKRTKPKSEGRFSLGKWKDNREKTQGGFVYDSLATALKKTAKEGNLQLVASILALGADVNYSSPKQKIRHYAFMDAHEADQQHVSDYLLSKGTDKRSVAKALRNTILRGQIEKAKKLVPHSELIRKGWSGIHPFNERVNINYEACCVSYAIAMKHPNRLELFRLIINDPSFMNANSLIGKFVVRSIIPSSLQTADAASPLAQFARTANCDLAMQGDLEGIKAFLERHGPRYKVKDNTPGSTEFPVVDPLGCIPISTWREDPARAIEIAELLIRHGADPASPLEK